MGCADTREKAFSDGRELADRVSWTPLVGSVSSTVIVVPCYNEQHRLVPASLDRLLDAPRVRLLLVDDGSTDGTASLLRELSAGAPTRVETLVLAVNGGKGEAIRTGLRHALERGADVVGYVDADFSTPPEEVLRLVAMLDVLPASVVLGSRVRLLGRDIRRRPGRHYLGRVFATVASVALGIPVYDTQCGAKLLRRTPALEAALEAPFSSRWAFDVELIGRLLRPTGGVHGLSLEDFVEVPLERWYDVKGSKLTIGQMARAGLDLTRIAIHLRRANRS